MNPNHNSQWPVKHILVGVPIVIAISYIIASQMKGWGFAVDTVLATATLVALVGPSYTFLVALAERSYLVVFWAREKTKGWLADARAEGEAQGEARGLAKQDRKWRDWYERMQAAQREGRPFDEEPPPAPPSRNQQVD